MSIVNAAGPRGTTADHRQGEAEPPDVGSSLWLDNRGGQREKGQIQAQRNFDRSTGKLNGSLSGAARFTSLHADYGHCQRREVVLAWLTLTGHEKMAYTLRGAGSLDSLRAVGGGASIQCAGNSIR
jgi:hypothetical protein